MSDNDSDKGFLRPMFIRNIPETLRHEFRVACLQAGYTMQDVIVACIRYLDTPEKIKEFME